MRLYRRLAALCTVAISLSLLHGQNRVLDGPVRTDAAGLNSDGRIALYEKRLREHPDDGRVQAGLASAFMQKLRETTDFAYLNRASAIVEKMLAVDPKNYDAIRLTAEMETHRHNFPRAASFAEELIQRNPSDTGAWGMLGDSFMELGKYDEAGEAYQRMLTLRPNLASYNRVAYHRFVTGKTDESLGWMSLAVQAGSPTPENLAWCLVEFGDMLFKTGRTSDAHQAYEQALRLLPGYHRAYGALGREFAAAGQFEKAAGELERALAVIPLPDYAGPLQTIYGKLGKTAQAKQQSDLLDVIDKLGRTNGEKGNRALAVVYADQNRNLARALELAQGELETRKDVYTYDALSWVLFRNGKQKEAEEASEKAMAMNTPEPGFYYHAGMIAIGAGKEHAGLDLLRRALELNPNFSYPQALDAKRRLGLVAADAVSATKSPVMLR